MVLVLIALCTSAMLTLPTLERLRGLSIDTLTAMRWWAIGPRHDPRQSPAVVIALDEETYRHKPFAGTPSVTWTGEIGKVIDAVVDGGARVVSLDVIFPTSLEQSTIPLDDTTLGARVRGLDREFLRALARAGRDGRLVLGEVQHQDRLIGPSTAQRIAVGGERNVRLLNVHSDVDDVVRRIPLSFATNDGPIPSMALELASRQLGKTSQTSREGGSVLNGWRPPQRIPGTLTLNFDGGSEEIPTYSLADLRQCVEKNDLAFFRRQFEGRAVLIGTLLDVEDRKLSSKRLATGVEGAHAERCILPRTERTGRLARDTIAGVYIHAVAVNNLLRRNPLTELGNAATWLASMAVALAAGAAVMLTRLSRAIPLLGLLSLAWLATTVIAFNQTIVLPLVESLIAGGMTVFASMAYRFAVTDRDKRLLRRSFSYYLAPALVERVVTSNTPPRLGGEIRTVTLFRSDLAGFSGLSERSEPDALVALMNEYLTAMTDIIGAHNGFVDKYIGDAIDGVFGVPIDDPDHAYHAVLAALNCEVRLKQMNAAGLPAFRGLTLRQRIGIHTGPGLVGNIGSRQRFNYTVMGDSANLASRIESANKAYGTAIMVSEAAVERIGDRVFWRELDTIRVVGRGAPLRVFEPLAVKTNVTGDQRTLVEDYTLGLAHWRQRDFAGAAAAFGRHAEADEPSRRMRDRAAKFAAEPPITGWEPVHTLEVK